MLDCVAFVVSTALSALFLCSKASYGTYRSEKLIGLYDEKRMSQILVVHTVLNLGPKSRLAKYAQQRHADKLKQQ